MKRVVMFSGGVGSWAAAKRVAERHGTADLTLLFADTRTEDQDTYRFLHEAAANVGGELVEISDGRTIWEVFRAERYLGNTRVDPCSKILKREKCDRWMKANCDPAATVIYVGIDWQEAHRFHRLAARRAPWRYEAPLCDPPYLGKDELHEWAEREGLRKQRLYAMGADHANCGGGCVKMGAGGFARLLRAMPERFAEWEANEQSLRDLLGDVAILRDRRGGTPKPMTLRALRERVEAGGQADLWEASACNCFVEEEPASRGAPPEPGA